MRYVIRLDENEIRKAIHEYVENNTRLLEEENAKKIEIVRDPETGLYEAHLTVEQALGATDA